MVDDKLVDNVNWAVAGFENDRLEKFHSVPWTFQKAGTVNGTVEGGNLWKGKWSEILPLGVKRLAVKIKTTANVVDKFNLMFVTQNRFIATKGSKVYRYRKKI